MKLTDLNPRWSRPGMMLTFDCPCGRGCEPVTLPRNPPFPSGWSIHGDSFETMTIEPSIQRVKTSINCDWHGSVQNGEVIPK